MSLRTPLLLALIILPSALVSAQAPTANSGWSQLWANHNNQARAAFQQALRTSPKDASANRGLATLAQQEDRPGAAAVALRALYPSGADWAHLGYWPVFYAHAEECGKRDLITAAAREIVASADAPLPLRECARYCLAEVADRAGKYAEADKIRTELGLVRKWRVIGPFSNVVRSGLNKIFPPEKGIDLTKAYPGKNEVQVRWHSLGLMSRDGQCQVQQTLGGGGESVVYAVTAVTATKETAARIGFDPQGASKVWLNGELVFQDSVRRSPINGVPDLFAFPVHFKAGANTILVKLANDRVPPCLFALRLTGAGGEPLTSVIDPAQANPAGVKDGSGASPTPDPLLAQPAREAAAKDPEAAALLSELRWRTGDHSGATEAARAALALQPGCGWLHYQLSHCLASENVEDDARAERQRALSANPLLLEAQLQELGDQQQELPVSQRLQRLKALLKTHPGSPTVHWALQEAYSEADLTAEAIREGRAALSRESKVPAVKLRKPGWVAVQTAHGRGELPDGERGWD